MKKDLLDFIDNSRFSSIDEYQHLIEPIVASQKAKLSDMVDNNTFVGIEVEVENIHKRTGFLALQDRAYLWQNVEDNSLRNEGREFVSLPIKGKQISLAVQSLFTGLKKDKTCAGYEFTDRTSVHVHVNYRDASVETLANTMLLYFLVEPLLYQWVGGDRAKNIFCVPLKDSDKLEDLSRLFKSFEADNSSGYGVIYEWTKYSGFNLAPLSRYGTIEYRHLVGTDNQDKILQWINIILKIKQYAEKASYDKLKATLLEMNTSSAYAAILNDMFGDTFPHNEMHNIHELLEESTMFIKEIYAFDKKDFKMFYVDVDMDSRFMKRYIDAGIFFKKDEKKAKPEYDFYEEAIRTARTTTRSTAEQAAIERARQLTRDLAAARVRAAPNFGVQGVTTATTGRTGGWTLNALANDWAATNEAPQRVILDEDF
jgi:hypothetical protein